MDNVMRAALIRPHPRQVALQSMEFYGFIHFGMNTMLGVEWGDGQAAADQFNPEEVDCRQWIRALKAAGMTGAILTAKHHDGFCLWPSPMTDYSVRSSPWRGGQGDLVREFADACREEGIKFGFYLSPWDRHEPSYGSGEAYDNFFVAQLTELLTQYGDVFSVWFDGANGEGPNGKVQQYNWERYYEVIRRLQPDAVIAISGPDVRWIGNEAGHTRQDEWSVVPIVLADQAWTAEHSQQDASDAFRQEIGVTDEDIGSRQAIKDYDGEFIWYPAEVDVSIRPGWFYHRGEDAHVKTSDQLYQLYLDAVGKNATLLLNVPPDASGKIHARDVRSLELLGQKIADLHRVNRLKEAKVTFSSNEQQVTSKQLTKRWLEPAYWQAAADDNEPIIRLEWPSPVTLHQLILKEQITEGQRAEETTIQYQSQDGQWHDLATVHSIGYQRIIPFAPIQTQALRIVFVAYRLPPTLSYILVS